METRRYIYYKEDDTWIGWLEEYPDYRTQGATLEELEDNLRDLYNDLSGDAVPGVRRVGELAVKEADFYETASFHLGGARRWRREDLYTR
jgi:hypothetical protein